MVEDSHGMNKIIFTTLITMLLSSASYSMKETTDELSSIEIKKSKTYKMVLDNIQYLDQDIISENKNILCDFTQVAPSIQRKIFLILTPDALVYMMASIVKKLDESSQENIKLEKTFKFAKERIENIRNIKSIIFLNKIFYNFCVKEGRISEDTIEENYEQYASDFQKLTVSDQELIKISPNSLLTMFLATRHKIQEFNKKEENEPLEIKKLLSHFYDVFSEFNQCFQNEDNIFQYIKITNSNKNKKTWLQSELERLDGRYIFKNEKEYKELIQDFIKKSANFLLDSEDFNFYKHHNGDIFTFFDKNVIKLFFNKHYLLDEFEKNDENLAKNIINTMKFVKEIFDINISIGRFFFLNKAAEEFLNSPKVSLLEETCINAPENKFFSNALAKIKSLEFSPRLRLPIFMSTLSKFSVLQELAMNLKGLQSLPKNICEQILYLKLSPDQETVGHIPQGVDVFKNLKFLSLSEFSTALPLYFSNLKLDWLELSAQTFTRSSYTLLNMAKTLKILTIPLSSSYRLEHCQYGDQLREKGITILSPHQICPSEDKNFSIYEEYAQKVSWKKGMERKDNLKPLMTEAEWLNLKMQKQEEEVKKLFLLQEEARQQKEQEEQRRRNFLEEKRKREEQLETAKKTLRNMGKTKDITKGLLIAFATEILPLERLETALEILKREEFLKKENKKSEDDSIDNSDEDNNTDTSDEDEESTDTSDEDSN